MVPRGAASSAKDVAKAPSSETGEAAQHDEAGSVVGERGEFVCLCVCCGVGRIVEYGEDRGGKVSVCVC